ncbi:MAG: SRPBCC family protein [Alphaproteobacteria bacterium]
MSATKTAEAVAKHTLRLERRFAQPPKRVYRAFTEVEELRTWWGPEGFTTPRAALDVRPGGTYALTMKAPSGKLLHLAGVFKVVEPAKRLVYTWSWREGDYAGIPTLVTLEFMPDGKGTRLRVTHEAMTSAEMADAHKGGWSSCLDRLAKLCKGAAA